MTPGLVLVIAAVCALTGAWIGHHKGQTAAGAWLGALLGVLGVLIIVCVPKTRERKIEEARARQEIEAAAREQRGPGDVTG
jgi:hypothetical protein